MNAVHNFLFNVYPYICLAVFFMGSLARFDRDVEQPWFDPESNRDLHESWYDE